MKSRLPFLVTLLFSVVLARPASAALSCPVQDDWITMSTQTQCTYISSYVDGYVFASEAVASPYVASSLGTPQVSYDTLWLSAYFTVPGFNWWDSFRVVVSAYDVGDYEAWWYHNGHLTSYVSRHPTIAAYNGESVDAPWLAALSESQAKDFMRAQGEAIMLTSEKVPILAMGGGTSGMAGEVPKVNCGDTCRKIVCTIVSAAAAALSKGRTEVAAKGVGLGANAAWSAGGAAGGAVGLGAYGACQAVMTARNK